MAVTDDGRLLGCGHPRTRLGSSHDNLATAAARGQRAAHDRYCIGVLHQLAAVHGSLDRVSRDILES